MSNAFGGRGGNGARVVENQVSDGSTFRCINLCLASRGVDGLIRINLAVVAKAV